VPAGELGDEVWGVEVVEVEVDDDDDDDDEEDVVA